MRILSGSTVQASDEVRRSPITAWAASILGPITRAINGNLTFGTGIVIPGLESGKGIDNIAGRWIDYESNATPDTEDTIQHNLGVIPPGFIVMVPPESGVINRGPTPWTATEIYLSCSAASQTARLFILLPPLT